MRGDDQQPVRAVVIDSDGGEQELVDRHRHQRQVLVVGPQERAEIDAAPVYGVRPLVGLKVVPRVS